MLASDARGLTQARRLTNSKGGVVLNSFVKVVE